MKKIIWLFLVLFLFSSFSSAKDGMISLEWWNFDTYKRQIFYSRRWARFEPLTSSINWIYDTIDFNLSSPAIANPPFSVLYTWWGPWYLEYPTSFTHYLWISDWFTSLGFQWDVRWSYTQVGNQLFFWSGFEWWQYINLDSSFARVFYKTWSQDIVWVNAPDYLQVFNENFITVRQNWKWRTAWIYFPNTSKFFWFWNGFSLARNKEYSYTWYEMGYKYSDLHLYTVKSNDINWTTSNAWITPIEDWMFIDMDWYNKSAVNSNNFYVRIFKNPLNWTNWDNYQQLWYIAYVCADENTCNKTSEWFLWYKTTSWSYSTLLLPYRDENSVRLISSGNWNNTYKYTMGMFNNVSMWEQNWYWTETFVDVHLSWNNQLCYDNWPTAYCLYMLDWYNLVEEYVSIDYTWDNVENTWWLYFMASWYSENYREWIVSYYENTRNFTNSTCDEFIETTIIPWTFEFALITWINLIWDNINISSIPFFSSWSNATWFWFNCTQSNSWADWFLFTTSYWYQITPQNSQNQMLYCDSDLQSFQWFSYAQYWNQPSDNVYWTPLAIQIYQEAPWYIELKTYQWLPDIIITWYDYSSFSSSWTNDKKAKYYYCIAKQEYKTWYVNLNFIESSIHLWDWKTFFSCPFDTSWTVSFKLKDIPWVASLLANTTLWNIDFLSPIGCMIAWYNNGNWNKDYSKYDMNLWLKTFWTWELFWTKSTSTNKEWFELLWNILLILPALYLVLKHL